MPPRRRIVPVEDEPEPNAFEREFNNNDNVLRGIRIYCGNKATPAGTVRGTPLSCFRRGIGIGSYIERQKTPARRSQANRSQIESSTRGLVIQQIADTINTKKKSMGRLKPLIHLDSLSKDMIREIASRQNIVGYSNMSTGQLINKLLEKGWKR